MTNMEVNWRTEESEENYSWGRGAHIAVADLAEWDKWSNESLIGYHQRMAGWRLHPINRSLYAAVTTKLSNNPLLDVICRVGAVYRLLRALWGDFCVWSEERRRFEECRTATLDEAKQQKDREQQVLAESELLGATEPAAEESQSPKESQQPWEPVWSAQVGYSDPSKERSWRLKYVLEIRTWEGMDTMFFPGTANARW